jgi:hypothetical protein
MSHLHSSQCRQAFEYRRELWSYHSSSSSVFATVLTVGFLVALYFILVQQVLDFCRHWVATVWWDLLESVQSLSIPCYAFIFESIECHLRRRTSLTSISGQRWRLNFRRHLDFFLLLHFNPVAYDPLSAAAAACRHPWGFKVQCSVYREMSLKLNTVKMMIINLLRKIARGEVETMTEWTWCW